MVTMMVGGKEGDGNGDNGARQVTAMATTRAMAEATRVAGDEESKGGEGGKGQHYSNEGGRQLRGQWPGWQGQWQW
jgi:hypothetical protein